MGLGSTLAKRNENGKRKLALSAIGAIAPCVEFCVKLTGFSVSYRQKRKLRPLSETREVPQRSHGGKNSN